VPGGRIGLVSLGCPKNLVDSEVMAGLLTNAGYQLAADAHDADVIVVNTCAFIDQARRESVDAILEMVRIKTQARGKRLVVAGCLAERSDRELRLEIPEIDATLGTNQIEDVVAAVKGEATTVRSLPGWLATSRTPRVPSTAPHLAYLKISEGCDYTCSFCVIPRLRGRYRSRLPADVVAEARRLSERGVKELVLVAQDTTRYGLDHGVRDGLAHLLRRLGRIDGLRWIRVMYAFPSTISERILAAIADVDKVVKYLDLPLQHASPTVLKRMRRPAGEEQLSGLLERIRSRVPGIALRTAFIVGFPGETERDFERLLAFVRQQNFEHVGVFSYSHEEGTAAHRLRPLVPRAEREERQRRVMALARRLALTRNRERLGQTVGVLLDGRHPESEHLLQGRLASQAPEIDGSVIINAGQGAAGELVRAQITQAHAYDLVGHIVAR
jgi:ribosomal protein S12 methylthiotransferase